MTSAIVGATAKGRAGILVDEELLQLLAGTPPLVAGLSLPTNPYERASPIQPVSVDLTIGKVYIPDTPPGAPGSVNSPFEDTFVLGPGKTALIHTSEVLNVPPNLAGFGFPPTTLALKGLLIPTVGHIDPGWVGPLRIVAINMSGDYIALVPRTHIATLVFFEVGRDPVADYAKRREGLAPQAMIREEDLNKLATDFADIESRMQRTTEKHVQAEMDRAIGGQLKRVWLQVGLASLMVPLLLALCGYLLNYFVSKNQEFEIKLTQQTTTTASDLTQIRRQIADLQAKTSASEKDIVALRIPLDVYNRLSQIELQLRQLETQAKSTPPVSIK